MSDYLNSNKEFWGKGYNTDNFVGNVESHIFRMYGRILKYEFGIDGSNKERSLDFGCSRGATVKFFNENGFDAYGVDISEVDIDIAKKGIPETKNNFSIIESKPKKDDMFFGGDFTLVTAVQSLYYYDKSDLQTRLESINNMLTDNGFVYFTMMGSKHYMYEHAELQDSGLYKVDFDLPRVQVKDYFIQFMHNEEEMIELFKIFEPLHVGFYDHKLRSDEGSGFHYTFFGKKR